MDERQQIDLVTIKIYASKRNEILPRQGASVTEATVEFQRRYLSMAILKSGGNVVHAANYLGMNRQNLYRKLTQLQLMMDRPHVPDSDPEPFYDVDVGGGI